MPTYARKHDFGAILDPRVSQEWTLWVPFSVRKAPKGYAPELPEPSRSRPGRDLRRKRSKNISSSILDRSLTDFGRVSTHFRLFFNGTSQNVSMDFFAFLVL